MNVADDLIPMPLMIFRSNSKFNEILYQLCSYSLHIRPITTEFYTRQLHVRDGCKISSWSVEPILNQNTANFDRISNSIKISLVGRAPGHLHP